MKHFKLIALVAPLLIMAACSTLGSNVSGDWSCDTGNNSGQNPKIKSKCPTIHEIDEKILKGESKLPVPVTGNAHTKLQITAGFSFTDDLSDENVEPTRTSDRIGRIVIMPFVDASGIFHDRAVVYAVMEKGKWKPAPQKPILKKSAFKESNKK
jgi:hypothetical protein